MSNSEIKEIKANTQSNLLSTSFLELARELQDYCHSSGCEHIRVSESEGHLPYFSSHDLYQKQSIVNRLKVFVQICRQTIAAGSSLKDTKKISWYGLRHLGFTFDSSMFDLISDSSTVEIYDKKNIQIFRNFRFLQHVSYTIEDIYCRPWTELFHRPDQGITEGTLAIIMELFASKSRKPIRADHLGRHRVIELHSVFKNEIDLEVLYLAPLFKPKSVMPAAFIAIETAELISTLRNPIKRELELAKTEPLPPEIN